MAVKKKGAPAPKVKLPSASELAKSMPVSVAAVNTITALARRQFAIERRIAAHEDDIRKLRGELYQLSTKDLPAAFQEAGTKSLTLDNNVKVEVKDFIVANIKAENKVKAFEWLRKSGYGSLIKSEIACSFGMGEEKLSKALKAALKKMKQTFSEKESVHSSTLLAFARERLKQGKSLSPAIDVTTIPTTVIIVPKEKA